MIEFWIENFDVGFWILIFVMCKEVEGLWLIYVIEMDEEKC